MRKQSVQVILLSEILNATQATIEVVEDFNVKAGVTHRKAQALLKSSPWFRG